MAAPPAPIPDLSAAVLAGGGSTRMGRDKARLELDGQRLIERVLERIAPLSDDLLVVTNQPERLDFLPPSIRRLPDLGGAGQGPLAGIAAALRGARHERVLVVATDMPFLDTALLRWLATLDPSADVTVPVIAEDGFPETLHAIYSRRALPAIERTLAAGRRKITHFFPAVRLRSVPREAILPHDPELHSFINTNTPEEWAAVERAIARARAE